jgi:hypothetical protein
MNKLLRKLGFSLVEVILGSVIIAGFVGTAVYTAGEIGTARRESLASIDRDALATLQTQYAAAGVAAPSTNTNVWGADGTVNKFGSVTSAGAGSSFYVNSSSANLNATNVSTKGTVGKSLCVNAFSLQGLNANPSRVNQQTVGLMLMDRAAYAAAPGTANNADHDLDPAVNPMKKPEGIFALTTSLAVARFDTTTGQYVEIPASVVTLDALRDVNWNSTYPAFYILIRSTSGTIDSATCTIYSTPNVTINMGNVPPGINGYTGAFPVTITSLKDLTSSLLGFSTSAYNTAANVYSNVSGSVSFTQINPTILQQRMNHPVIGSPSVISTNVVTIYDVIASPNKEYNSFRSGVSALNGVTLDNLYSSSSSSYLKTNVSTILPKITIYDYLDTTATPASVQQLTASGYNDFTPVVTSFKASAGVWRTALKGASLSVDYGALIRSTATVSSNWSITTMPRPTVAFSPVSGSTIESTSGVTAYASNPIMSSGLEDISANGNPSLYNIYYNYGTSSMSAVPTPGATSGSYNGVITSYTGSVNLGTLPDGATVYVKAIALPAKSALDDNSGVDPYKLFLTSSSDAQASGKYTYDSDPYKVLAYVNILDNLNGYVQGSIQVRDACNFNANGNAAVGFELRLNFETKFGLNGGTQNLFTYYSTDPTSSYYLPPADVLTKVQKNSGKVYIIGPSKTYTLNNGNEVTTAAATNSNYKTYLNIFPISIETSIVPKDPEGVYMTSATSYTVIEGGTAKATPGFYNCTTDKEVTNGQLLTLTAGNTYYFNNLKVESGGIIAVSGSGTATLYVKNLTFNGGTIGNSGSVSALNAYVLNDVTFNGSSCLFYGKLHCGTFVKTTTVSPTSPDGYLHNYTSGSFTINAGSTFSGKVWAYRLNMNGDKSRLLIQ